ncbi:MAG TPA: PAS domain S-box protein [Kamptonema sp.]|nr:PAS domain S-box protein [Kamptonema sp.]
MQKLIKKLPNYRFIIVASIVLLLWYLSYNQVLSSQPSLQKTVVVRANDADWQVDVSPTPALTAKVNSDLPIFLLIGGLALILLFALAVHFIKIIYCEIDRLKKENRQLQSKIQQQQQAEIENARLAAIVEYSEDAIISKNLDSLITSWNAGAREIFGYTASEIVGQSINKLIPAEDQTEENKILSRIQRGEHIKHYETKRLRKDGTLIYVSISVSPIKDERGNVIGASKIARNITERKQAEAELRELSAVMENAVSGFSKLDPQGRYLYVNKAYSELTGYDPEEMIGMPWTNTVHPDELEKLVSIYWQMVKQSKVEVETKGIRKDGSVFDKQLVMIANYDEQHQLLGHYCFMKDISDRKQKELALLQAMAAAESANIAKSIFLANMSHELRTPLNIILGFAQVMARDPSLTPNQQEDLQTIRRSGDHLLSLINEVLDLSKIESGQCTVEKSNFDLIGVLHSLQNMFAELARVKGLSLCFEIAPEVPQFILADTQKLRQVLLNLLSNAIKFTDRGSITLRVSIETPDTENTSKTQSILQFVVTDTGVGIAPSEVDIIFDAFVQAQAGKRLVSGTGLGLAISRKLVKLMGGEITVNSILGQGSRFTFTLPFNPTSKVNIIPEQSDRLVIGLAPDQPHYRILVVDDSAENRLLIVRLLAQLQLEVREATNGQEAVQIWQEWLPDLIWMDIRMPVLDGYEATKQIRALEQKQTTIIIALTAHSSESDRTLAFAAGCNDYISKPFSEQTLFLKMAEYLGLEYVYEEQAIDSSLSYISATISPVSDGLNPTLLATLPEIWLAQLEDAAICGKDREIAELAAQLPPEMAQLASDLIDLAERYQFEQIIKMIQVHSQT